MTPTCPNCGNVWNLAGIEVRGMYDGVAIWWCQQCQHRWPRFPVGTRLHDQAVRWLADHPDVGLKIPIPDPDPDPDQQGIVSDV
jgi:hypothetical protein